MGGVPLFKATGSTTQPTDTKLNSHGSRPASIRLQGLRLDTITAAGTVLVNEDARLTCDQAAVRQMFNEIEAFLKRPSIYPETEWADALWRIPICDREYHPRSGYTRRATADRSGKQFTALRTQPLEGDVVGETFSYQATMQYKDGARPILSDKGYVGLGPRETEPGDVIVLLYGATAPFILRSAGGAGEYHLVGEAYVYGVMDGEMMNRGLDLEGMQAKQGRECGGLCPVICVSWWWRKRLWADWKKVGDRHKGAYPTLDEVVFELW
jgi:hypothetical protein